MSLMDRVCSSFVCCVVVSVGVVFSVCIGGVSIVLYRV